MVKGTFSRGLCQLKQSMLSKSLHTTQNSCPSLHQVHRDVTHRLQPLPPRAPPPLFVNIAAKIRKTLQPHNQDVIAARSGRPSSLPYFLPPFPLLIATVCPIWLSPVESINLCGTEAFRACTAEQNLTRFSSLLFRSHASNLAL